MSEAQLRLITTEGKERQRQGNYAWDCEGVFYVTLVAPEYSSTRIKMGFSTDLETRLIKHRVISPNIRIIKTWGCRRKWEKVGLDYLSKHCTPIGSEVYECHNIPELIKSGDKLFSLFEVRDARY